MSVPLTAIPICTGYNVVIFPLLRQLYLLPQMHKYRPYIRPKIQCKTQCSSNCNTHQFALNTEK